MPEYKSSIKKSFSKAAKIYDKYALVQKLSAERLAENLPKNPSAKNILDIGCGTGFLSEELLKKYFESQITGMDISGKMLKECLKKFSNKNNFSAIKDDAEKFTSYENYDIICSTYCFQWFKNTSETLKQIKDNMKSKSIFSLAVPIKGSFLELDESLKKLGEDYSKTFELLSEENWKDFFTNAGFNITFNKTYTDVIYFKSAIEVLKSFNKIGAGLKNNPSYKTLNFIKIKKLAEIYKTKYMNNENKIPKTYKTLLITGSK